MGIYAVYLQCVRHDFDKVTQRHSIALLSS